jgi:hypothetical protein
MGANSFSLPGQLVTWNDIIINPTFIYIWPGHI